MTKYMVCSYQLNFLQFIFVYLYVKKKKEKTVQEIQLKRTDYLA